MDIVRDFFYGEMSGMINFDFDFYEIVVWVATFAMCLIAMAARSFPLKAQGGLGQPLPNPIAAIFPIAFYVSFAGLRRTIGDTYFYMYSFQGMPDENEVSLSMITEGRMYEFIQNIIRNHTDDPQVLILICAIIALVPPLLIFYFYSSPFELSIYMFVAYGYLGGMMDGMRQYMAAAIILLGTKFLFSMKRGAFFKYAIFVILAYWMHSSAIIMLVVFFIVRRKAWKRSSYIIVLGSVIVTACFDAILPSFLNVLRDTSYAAYADNGWFTEGKEGGSSLFRAVVAAAPIVVAYLNRERMNKLGHIGDILINMAFLNMAVYIVASYNWIFARLGIYLQPFFIIFTGWVVFYAVKQKDRAIYTTGLVLLFFLYSRFMAYQIYMYQSDYFLPGRKLFR